MNPLRALVIVAHPDDIEFGAAGTIARWAEEGVEVTFCIVTDGGAGSNAPDIDLAELILTRQREQREAAALLGVHEVVFMGYRDGTLEPTLELRRDLTRLIRRLRPQRVMTQDPSLRFVGNTYINHPDHRAASETAVYACFPSAGTRPIFPELLAEGLEPHDVDEVWLMFSEQADTFVDVTPYIDRKIQALLCHRSQVGPEVEEMVRGWGRATGSSHSYEYAESFRVMKLRQDNQPAQTDERVAINQQQMT